MNIKKMNLSIEEYAGYIYASDSKNFYGNDIVKVYIDYDDFEKVKKYGWYISGKGYVYTMIKNHTVFLHRFLLEYISDNVVVDHNDGNKLNNQKNNLFTMSNEENLQKAWDLQGLYNTSKQTAMYDLSDTLYNNPIKIFKSQNEAISYLKTLGIHTSQGALSNACLGRRKTCGGFRWRCLL